MSEAAKSKLIKLLFFSIGSLFLCSFSLIQKIATGAPLGIQGFFVPFIIGGIAGLVIGTRQSALLKLNRALRLEIAEHHEAKTAFHESQQLFKTLSDLSYEGILIHESGIAIDVNKSLQKMVGYGREELLGKNIYELAIPEEYHSTIKKNMAKESTKPYEVMVRHKDGGLFHVEIESKNVRQNGKEFRVTALRDISERRASDQKIAILSTAIDQNPSSIVITDPQGVIEYVNPKFSMLAGYTFAEAVGQKASILKSGAQSDKYYKDLWETISAGKMWSGRFQNINKTGDLYWEHAKISPIIDDNGKITHYVAVKEDITSHIAAEAALQSSETRLSNAQHLAHIGDWELDFETDTLSWSDEIYRIFGLEPLEFEASYESFLEQVHPLDREYVDEAFERSLKDKLPYDLIHRLLLKDGSVKFVHEHCETSFDEDGQPLRSIGTVQDVTDSKLAGDALQQSESNIQSIIQSLHESFIITYDIDGNHIDVWGSEELEKRYGIRVDDVIGKSLEEIVPPDVAKSLLKQIKRLFKTGISETAEFKTVYPTGEFWHDISLSPLFNSHGEVTLAICFVRDITRSKHIEFEMKASEARYRTLFEYAPDPILIHNGKSILDVNTAALNAFELSHKPQLVGQDPFGMVHHDDLALSKERFSRLLRSEKKLPTTEVRIVTPAGDVRYALATPVSIDYEGEPAVMVNYHDITERKQAEIDRRNLEQQLRQSQKLETVGTMVGGIAHDFNNILQSMFLYVGILQDKYPEDKKFQKHVTHILGDADRAKNLIEQILTFSRKSELKLEAQSLHEVVAEALSFEKSSLPANIEIQHNIDAKCGAVLCDKTQIYQIILNLCNNSIHAIGQEWGIIQVDLLRSIGDKKDAEKPFVELVVKDNGSGMSKETLERIFDPFYTTKEIGSGTGLGLSVIHGIVEMMGARIYIDSEMNAGTSIKIRMPVVEEYLEQDTRPPDGQEVDFGQKHVLLVDDEDAIREMGKKIISQKGHIVDTASDGLEAFRLFKANPSHYDLIITDLSMPAMSGIELSRLIRDIDPHVLIILSSGNFDQDQFAEYHGAGVSEFLRKPWTTVELLDMWNKLMRKTK